VFYVLALDLHYVFLKEEDFDTVYGTFVKAFSDYQIRMEITREQFKEMNVRRGLCYELSAGAVDDGGKMVGLALNGADFWDRKLTAYDMGTGVIPEFRGKGVADGMLDFLIPKLRQSGVKQYLLEVIRSNLKAYNLYKKKGFRETRRFECFTAEVASLNLKGTIDAEDGFLIKPMEKPDWSFFESFWEWRPSWQNSVNSVTRSQGRKVVLGAFKGSRCVGYGIIYSESGDIPQFAVKDSFRRQGVGTLLMKALAREARRGRLAVVNVDSSSQVTLDFLTDLGFKNFAGQYEMVLEL
jgi:ribosomal protein S18 acetylase RimI-like enzyme